LVELAQDAAGDRGQVTDGTLVVAAMVEEVGSESHQFVLLSGPHSGERHGTMFVTYTVARSNSNESEQDTTA
jgi:hypothetical protein